MGGFPAVCCWPWVLPVVPRQMPVHGRQNYRAGPDPRHEFHPARARLTDLSVDGDTLYPPARPAWLGGQAVTVSSTIVRNGTKAWAGPRPGGFRPIPAVMLASTVSFPLEVSALTSTRRNFWGHDQDGTRSLKSYRWAGYQITFDWTGTDPCRSRAFNPGCGQGTNQKAAATPPNAQEICSWEDDGANPDIRSGLAIAVSALASPAFPQPAPDAAGHLAGQVNAGGQGGALPQNCST